MEYLIVFAAGIFYDLFFVGRLGDSSLKLLLLLFLIRIFISNFGFWRRNKRVSSWGNNFFVRRK